MVDVAGETRGTRHEESDQETAESCHASAVAADSRARPLRKQFADLRDNLLLYLDVRKDQSMASLRRKAMLLLLVAHACIVWVAMLIAAAIMFMNGMAGAAAAVIDGRDWPGELAVGGSLLLAMLLSVAVGAKLWTSAARRRTIEKYERLH
jgi:hypothetical protein